MLPVKTNSIRESFQNECRVTQHNYPTRHGEYNFKKQRKFAWVY